MLLALGLAFDETVVVALGGTCVLSGALGAAWMVSKVIRTPRKWPIPVSAMHLLAGFTWFLVGSVALAISAWHGVTGVGAFFLDFLTIFVGGWIVQVLLGAWSFLLPMARPGHPDTHRAGLIAMEFAGFVQLICLNVGVALMALRAAGWVGEASGVRRGPARAVRSRDRAREGVGLPGARELGPVRPPRCRRVGPAGSARERRRGRPAGGP